MPLVSGGVYVVGMTSTLVEPVDVSPMDTAVDDLSSVSTERLEAAIGAGAARIAALQCKWLLLLNEFIARGGHDRWGMTPDQWLSWRCGLDRVTAREHLRVGRCISELSSIREAFAAGRLSYSKVRAITRVATPSDEADWMRLAIELPASRLAQVAGQYRTVTAAGERETAATQSLTWSWDTDGSLVGSFRLAPTEGAQFLAAIRTQQATSCPHPVDSAEAEAGPDAEAEMKGHGGVSPWKTPSTPFSKSSTDSRRRSLSLAGHRPLSLRWCCTCLRVISAQRSRLVDIWRTDPLSAREQLAGWPVTRS